MYDVSNDIWEQKYRDSSDKTVEDTWARIARALAVNELKKSEWESKFLSILEGFRFLPGGRIISNAGTARQSATMFNCFVMGDIPDSMAGILETVKEAGLTQKQGGGVGYDFSTLRPRGDLVQGVMAPSSGPISFMKIFDATCQTIMSAGNRRGAQMGVMRIDHPDVEEFVLAKRGNLNLKMFNLSVAVTDAFMEALKKGEDWPLVFKDNVHRTVRSRELWDLIMKSTYDFAEPGVLFIDRINALNNLHYCETIRATNPCGELPLPAYGACLLGSVNLTAFVENPFTETAKIDLDGIVKTVSTAVRMLDNVIDLSNFPLEAQANEARSKRRIGIGVTGFANMLSMLGVRYGSAVSAEIAEETMRSITFAAYEQSVRLASEKGRFPLFDATKYCEGGFIRTLPKELVSSIRSHGMRNSHLTSIAPTGTISLLAGNVSSGIEPVFALSYKRKIRTEADKTRTVEVEDFSYRKFREARPDEEIPEAFVTTSDLSPSDHVNVQAAFQKWVDSSISKTINVPEDIPFDQFKDVYTLAYEKGLKGCTTFRPSSEIMGILETEKKKKDEVKTDTVLLKMRPDDLTGRTYKIKTPLSPDAIYVTINDIRDEDGYRPYEIFINTKNLSQFSTLVAMTRLISAIFRREKNPKFLVEELKSIYDPNGGYFSKGEFIPSMIADIGRIIERHLTELGLTEKKEREKEVVTGKPNDNAVGLMICPQCNHKSLVNQEHCLKCLECGYSKCG